MTARGRDAGTVIFVSRSNLPNASEYCAALDFALSVGAGSVLCVATEAAAFPDSPCVSDLRRLQVLLTVEDVFSAARLSVRVQLDAHPLSALDPTRLTAPSFLVAASTALDGAALTPEDVCSRCVACGVTPVLLDASREEENDAPVGHPPSTPSTDLAFRALAAGFKRAEDVALAAGSKRQLVTCTPACAGALLSSGAPPLPSTTLLAGLSTLLSPSTLRFCARYELVGPPRATEGPSTLWRSLVSSSVAAGTPVLPPCGWEEGGGKGGEGDATTPPPPHSSPAPWRIGVLGGSFNPPTLAHMQAACNALACGAVDEVWVVPCGPRPDKPSNRGPRMPTPLQRHIMTHLAVEACVPAGLPVRVLPLELGELVSLASYTLMSRLQEWGEGALGRPGGGAQQHAVRFHLLVGADLVPSLPTWRYAQELLESVRFLAFSRPGAAGAVAHPSLPTATTTTAPPLVPAPKHLAWITHPAGRPYPLTMRVSSSEARERVRSACTRVEGDESERARVIAGELAPLLPSPVTRYIVAEGLYRECGVE